MAARRTWLSDALKEALGTIDPAIVSEQIRIYAPADVRRILATIGIRDEQVFPTPIVLESKPTLVGYYRLLIGISQKKFYRSSTGMVPFGKMEKQGVLLSATQDRLPEFCRVMSDELAKIVRQLTRTLAYRDINDLQLLTLGSNFYGSANNRIGQAATLGIFEAIVDLLGDHIERRTKKSLSIAMPSGRTFLVALSNDPDVAINETTDSVNQRLVAIEIKGGSDAANVYNRGGEAEKSHNAARSKGYVECWTVIRTAGIDIAKLRRGSPTTDVWFDTTEILAGRGTDWDNFENNLRRILG